MKVKRILSVILIMSIIVTNFSSLVQISAQTEEGIFIQAAQVTVVEDGSAQTASRPAEPIYEFVIDNKEKFSVFMTTPVFWGSKYKIILSCDIDMRGKAFNLIKEFGGVFDGRGHTVSNLKIQNKSGKGKNGELAFINTLNEYAEIKNVTFDNYTIEGKSDVKKVAGLIVTNHGTISSVDIVNGRINNIDKKANAAGYVLKNEEEGVIENCFVGMNNKDANIKSGFVLTNTGKITKCSTKLCVNSKDIAGGFCGSNSGEIDSCKAEGAVKASAKKGITICGGFVGENSGIIKNSSSTGEVEGQEFTGGFAGINSDKGEISSCKATCDVKSHTYVATINCGGFVGVDAGKIEDCSFKGKVDGCVDSEKVLGIAVGVTVGVILVIATTWLFFKCKYSMFVKQRDHFSSTINLGQECNPLDIFYEYVEKEYKQLENPEFNIMAAMGKPEFVKYVFEKYKYELLNHEREDVRIWANCIDKIYYYESILNKIKPIILQILAGTVLGGATIRCGAVGLTAGRKCANVGAFCGVNAGEISRCDANNSSLTVKSMYNKYSMCGGFVGINSETGTIKECGVTGNEIHNKTYTGGHLGGFVGDNSGKIENGTTTVSVANGKYTGGFCGNNLGEISGSRSEGNATANATAVETKCGGFVGNNDKQGKVSSCISTGSATGQEYVGGFCGDNKGEISKSRSEGNAKASTKVNTNRCGGFVGENAGIVKDSNSKGSATGEEYVGGFAGVNKSNISGCNATGKATAKTKTHTALAGGFVGENEKGTIISCTATGGADSRSSSGQAKAGGFVGINKASIMSSKSSGNVYLSAGTFRTDDGCGGFVGKNDQGGSIDGCYAEATVETTNKKKGGGFVGEAKSKSTIKNSQSKTKIVTKSGTKNNTKFCENKDKKAVIAN